MNNQTNVTVLTSAVENLKHFIPNEECKKQVAQKGGLNLALKVLTTQDYDTSLVQKTLDLLDQLLVSNEIKGQALEADVLSILNNLLSTQKQSPEVLNKVTT